jgi:hypothetical protein
MPVDVRFPGDIRLPYADQYQSQVPPLPLPPLADFYNDEFGRIPCRHDWLPPTGQFGGQTNSLTYGLRVRTADYQLALQYVLGWARKGGPNGNFIRVLPITDPDNFGMAATEVSIRGYETPSGMIKLEILKTDGGVDGPAPGNLGVYNNLLSSFFDATNLPAFPPQSRPNESLRDVYKYVILNVKFEHVMYWIASDDVINSYSVQAGGDCAERQRFMIWNYIPGIEYVSLDSNTLFWTEGPQPGNTVGKGAGFVRSTGELKGTWYGIPAESLVILLQKWTGTGAFPPDPNAAFGNGYPMNGKTNLAPFSVDITNLNGFITFQSDTLLWQPPRTVIRPNVLGFRTYDVEISLTHRPEQWNKFLHWPTGKYFTARYSPKPPDVPRPVYQQTQFAEGFTG